MAQNIIRVAIDGPAAAGKSTVAKIVAKKLGFTYMDTGAMYRVVTWYCLKHQIDCKNKEKCESIVNEVHIDLKPNNTIYCNGIDVTHDIRTTQVSGNVSYIASYKGIRLVLSSIQKEFAKKHSVVMDGRDIGTYVIPDAEVKIFLIADVETRARRRYNENIEKHIPCTYEDIVEDVRKRDHIDSHRDFAPLTKARDAVEVDSSNKSIDEVVNIILNIYKEKIGE